MMKHCRLVVLGTLCFAVETNLHAQESIAPGPSTSSFENYDCAQVKDGSDVVHAGQVI